MTCSKLQVIWCLSWTSTEFSFLWDFADTFVGKNPLFLECEGLKDTRHCGS